MQAVAAKRKVTITVQVEVTDDMARSVQSLLGELQVRLATEAPEAVYEDFYGANVLPMADKVADAQYEVDRDLMWTLDLAAEDFFRGKGMTVRVTADTDGDYEGNDVVLWEELNRLHPFPD